MRFAGAAVGSVMGRGYDFGAERREEDAWARPSCRLSFGMGTVAVLKTTKEQLGNQLLPYMSIYAACLHAGHRLIYLPFRRYHAEFDRLPDFPGSGARNAVLYRVLRLAQHARLLGPTLRGDGIATHSGDSPHSSFIRLSPTGSQRIGDCRGVHFLVGWRFYNPRGIAAHRGEVQRAFSPDRRYRNSITSFLSKLPRDRPVIGVHMRFRDFRRHYGGSLAVSLDEYRSAMEDLRKLLGAPEPRFVLFSDEPVSDVMARGFDCVASRGSMIEDFFRMSACRLVIGTSSTFNLCAALYGGGRVWHLRPLLRRLIDPEGEDPEIVPDAEAAARHAGTGGLLDVVF